MDQTLFEKTDHYISSLLATESEALQETTRSTAQADMPDISISPVQGKLLQVFAAACNATRILELGTLGAYSTIWLAECLPEHGKLVTIEYDEHHARVAGENIARAGLQDKIELLRGKALDILPQLVAAKEVFDLIFIDADKPPYTEYFQFALQLSRPGTIIICDNVVRNGKVLDADSEDDKVQGVRRLNEFLSSCREVTATIIQTVGVKEYDGMAIAVVKHGLS